MTDDTVVIRGDDCQHILRVMRMKQGDRIICCDGTRTALCELKDFTNESVTAVVVKWLEERRELPVFVAIAQGLPKADKLEFVIQKGTEMGASEFIVFSARRSIVKWDKEKAEKKLKRLEKIAKEAAEQSHRTCLPKLGFSPSFAQLAEESDRFDLTLVAYEEAAKNGEATALKKALTFLRPGQSVLFVTGPEGGFSDEEVSMLQRKGFIVCGLGPRILRAETAPLYFLAAVSYQTELM